MRNQRTRMSRVIWAWCCFTMTVAVCLGMSLNDAQAAPTITSPTPGTTLTGSTETFSWTAGGSVVTEWWLYVGTNPGERDVYNSGSLGTATSDTVSVLPTNGATLHVRLWFRVDGEWKGTNFIYTAFASDGSSGGLSAVPPWDQVLPAAERFVLVLGGEAVLDKETGLVWEQDVPSLGEVEGSARWSGARRKCASRSVGSRKGWRLPSVHELASLVDPNAGRPATALVMPNGPFQGIEASNYWSATTSLDNPDFAWLVSFSGIHVGEGLKTAISGVWCVRGGGILSAY